MRQILRPHVHMMKPMPKTIGSPGLGRTGKRQGRELHRVLRPRARAPHGPACWDQPGGCDV